MNDSTQVERVRGIRAIGLKAYIKATGLHSVSARRRRAVRYAEAFRAYVADVRYAEVELQIAQAFFEEIRELLAKHCHPSFARLTFDHAIETLKQKRGPDGAAGIAARWGAAVRAFDDATADAAARRYRQAKREATPARRSRNRSR